MHVEGGKEEWGNSDYQRVALVIEREPENNAEIISDTSDAKF